MTEPRIKLTVVSGPDSGMSFVYDQPKVTIGRNPKNDFVLTDGFVSGQHGAFERTNDGEVVYRDTESRHGSLVVVDSVSVRLHQDDDRPSERMMENGAEVQVGCTLIRLDMMETRERLRPEDVEQKGSLQEVSELGSGDDAPAEKDGPGSDQHDKVITQALEPVQTISQRFEDDERLGILFSLAGELNGLTGLDEILDRVVNATFDAFKNANFFAITLVSDPSKVDTESPFFTRIRGDLPAYDEAEDDEPIISTSILRHVVESQESVLFLKDSMGSNVTESILEAQITSCLCAPLVGQRSLLGVMQVDTRGQGGVFSRRDLDLFSVLASNVAFAIERAELSSNIVEMFESFVSASVNAIEARDPTTAGHSERVTEYTLKLAERVNNAEGGRLSNVSLSGDELTELRYAALLHDFGKIAVDEAILQKSKRLPEDRLSVIEQRFETIKLLDYRRRVHRKKRQATDQTPNSEAFRELEKEHEAFCEEVDEHISAIRHAATATSLDEQEIQHIENIAARNYKDSDGEQQPFLTADEVRNLTIPSGTLNDEEWQAVKRHPMYSESLLERIPWSDDLEKIPTIAGAHHEKLDGSGYPEGMGSEELSIQVRMLTVADIFDALTATDRAYRDAFSVDQATQILRDEADEGKLDPECVRLFVDKVVPDIVEMIPRIDREDSQTRRSES
jgi:3',5'-cyclic-nucleotide phosphodiesterase